MGQRVIWDNAEKQLQFEKGLHICPLVSRLGTTAGHKIRGP